MYYTLLYISVFWSCVASLFHPVHYSITNMDYSKCEQEVQVSSKIFKDDFRLVLFHLFEKDIDVDNPEKSDQNLKLIHDYYTSHLIINDGNEKSTLHRTSITTNEEYIIFNYYFQVKNEFTQLDIVNTILLDLYFDQKNMLIFGFENKEKGYLFNIRETKHKVLLDDF